MEKTSQNTYKFFATMKIDKDKIKNKLRIIYCLLILILFFLQPVSMSSQNCKSFHKKCLFVDNDNKYSGLSRSLKLKKGQCVRVVLNFYGGKEYRIVFCCPKKVNVQFIMKENSAAKNILYDNITDGFVQSTNVIVRKTKKIIFEITIPYNERLAFKYENLECVGLAVTYKKINTKKK